ncbi:MAG: hypothetical protein GX423_03710 [Nitrospiraceae bacterium]|nr:hypothetical protein [Nitrospiraceae bacterium]
MRSEEVLVVARENIAPYLKACRKGLISSPETVAEILEIIYRDAFFMERSAAENDACCKQIIPYVTLCCNDRLLMIRRKRKQTEQRLHDLYSIGQGGHINPLSGARGASLIRAELERELMEEVALAPGEYSLSVRGIINDDENDVGSVHLGLWYVADTNADRFRTNEPDKIEGAWTPRREVLAHYDTLETWSQIAADSLLREE